MADRPYPDPNALTQPIPVVRVAPPPRTSGVRTPSGFAAAPGPYVHRFGNVPWYLFARFAAYMLDFLGIAFVVATFAYHMTERGFMLFAGRDETGYLILAALSFGVSLSLAIACEALFGTTLGKLVFALRVRRRDGRPAGAVRAFVRALLRPVDLLVVGPVLALVTPRHQRVGDTLAGTVVAGSRSPGFASLLGIMLWAGLAYAQITYGGGVTSALGVAAETAAYAPSVYARAARAFGVAVPKPATSVPNSAPAGSGTANV
jgi:uncharacterized RDD family membrane protein YckC